MDPRTRLRWSFVAALAAHAAFGWSLRVPRARIAGADPSGTAELDVEVESAVAGEREAVAESASVPARREGPARAEAPAPAPRSRTEVAPPSDASPSPGALAAEPSDGASWTFSPTGPSPEGARPSSSVALDDAIRDGVRATVAEQTKIDPLKRALGGPSQRDVELGLVPGGGLVSLVRDLVRMSGAPVVGHATFEVAVNGAGVASVRVLDSSSERARWDEVADAIAVAARDRKIPTPVRGRGFALTLEVTSGLQGASGRAPTDSAVTKALRAIDDPIDAVIESSAPSRRVVAARVLDVHAL